MRKILLLLHAFAAFSYGMECQKSGWNSDHNLVSYTLKDIPENVFSLKQLGTRMAWEGAIASFIHVFYDEYHGLKMFGPLTVSAFDSKEKIISTLWNAFHIEVIAKPMSESGSRFSEAK